MFRKNSVHHFDQDKRTRNDQPMMLAARSGRGPVEELLRKASCTASINASESKIEPAACKSGITAKKGPEMRHMKVEAWA